MQRRMKECYAKTKNYYILNLENGSAIDSGLRGSAARFANHSCSPNSEMQKWYVNGIPRIGLFASDSIPAGTELTYDYNFDWFEGAEMQVCLCGEPNCRGFIGRKSQRPDSQRVSPKAATKATVEASRAKSSSGTGKKLLKKSILGVNTKLLKISKRGSPRGSRPIDNLIKEPSSRRGSSIRRAPDSSTPTAAGFKRKLRKSIVPPDSPEKKEVRKRKSESLKGKGKGRVNTNDNEESTVKSRLSANGNEKEIQDEAENSHDEFLDAMQSSELEPEIDSDVIETTSAIEQGQKHEEVVKTGENTVTELQIHEPVLEASTMASEDAEKVALEYSPPKVQEDATQVSPEIPSTPVQAIPRRRGRPKGSKSRKSFPSLQDLPLTRVMRSSSQPLTPVALDRDRQSQRISITNTSPLSHLDDSSLVDPLSPPASKKEESPELSKPSNLSSSSAPILLDEESKSKEAVIHPSEVPAAASPVNFDSNARLSDSDSDYLTPPEGSPSLKRTSSMVIDKRRSHKESDVSNVQDMPASTSANVEEMHVVDDAPMSSIELSVSDPNPTSVTESELEPVIEDPLPANLEISQEGDPSSTDITSVPLKDLPTEEKTVEVLPIKKVAKPKPTIKVRTPRAKKDPKTTPNRPRGRKKSLVNRNVREPTLVHSVETANPSRHDDSASVEKPLPASIATASEGSKGSTRSGISSFSDKPPELPEMVPEPRLVKLTSPIFTHSHDVHGTNEGQSTSTGHTSAISSHNQTDMFRSGDTQVPGPALHSPYNQGGNFRGSSQVRHINEQLPTTQFESYTVNQQHPDHLIPIHRVDATPRLQEGSHQYYSPHSVHGTSQPPQVQPAPYQSLPTPVTSHVQYASSYPPPQQVIPSHTGYLPPPGHQYSSHPDPPAPFNHTPYHGSHVYSANQPSNSLPAPLPSIHPPSATPQFASQVPGMQSQYSPTPIPKPMPPHPELYEPYSRRPYGPPPHSVSGPDPGRPAHLADILNHQVPYQGVPSLSRENSDSAFTAPRRHSIYQSPGTHENSGNLSTDPQNYMLQRRESVSDKSWRQQVSIQSLVTSEEPQRSVSMSSASSSHQSIHGHPESADPRTTAVSSAQSEKTQQPKLNPISAIVHPTIQPLYPNAEAFSNNNPSHSSSNHSVHQQSPRTESVTPSTHRFITSGIFSYSSDSKNLTSTPGMDNSSSTNVLHKAPQASTNNSSTPASTIPNTPSTPIGMNYSPRSDQIQSPKTASASKSKRRKPSSSTRSSLASPQQIAPLASPTALVQDASNNFSPKLGRPKKKGRPAKDTPPAANKPRRGRPPNSAPTQRPYLAPLALRPAISQESPSAVTPDAVKSLKPAPLASISPIVKEVLPSPRLPRPLEASPISIAPKPVESSKKRSKSSHSDDVLPASKKPRTLPPMVPNLLRNSQASPTSDLAMVQGIESPSVRPSAKELLVNSSDVATPTRGRISSSPRLTVTNAIKAAVGSSRSSLAKGSKSGDSPSSSSGETPKRGRGRPRTRPKDYWTYNNRKARGEFGPGSFAKANSASISSPSNNSGSPGQSSPTI